MGSSPSPHPAWVHWDVQRRAEITYLIAGLGLPDEDEGIGGDDRQAKIDEDDGPLRADVPMGQSGLSAQRGLISTGTGVLWPYQD